MSLTSAFNAATTGLSLTSRWASTTSLNISNANTLGYARRTPNVTVSATGEPIVNGISRAIDYSLDSMYHAETARTGTQSALAEVLTLYTTTLGGTDSTDGMLARLTDFQSSMNLLAITPSDTSLQRAAVTDAEELVNALNRADSGLEQARNSAAGSAATDVAEINTLLSQIAKLNARIETEAEGTDTRLTFEDKLTQALDDLSPLIDYTVRYDSVGRVEIFTTGGTPLLQGDEPSLLAFDKTTLSLTAGGIDITPNVDGVRGINEGTLAGYITFLNTKAPEIQAQLDEVARALIQGFQDSDASLAAGDAGLFTDAGVAITGPITEGLAGRIAINDAVLPEAGGELWRLRDGIGATVEGAQSDPTQINAFIDFMNSTTSFDSAAGLGDSATLTSYISTLIASQQTLRSEAETSRDSYSAGADTIQSTRMGFMGVNVDDELQQLLLIEQSYGANSQVLQTINEMFEELLSSF
ncbi:flagellar hook-associated protein FlgK [Pseudooceanicola sp. LIPI14-2-Ac024]|uniref:flagellar hook-associated protein FlgK n=1 Tax=Pseudooceanicola sp. LIPI14-2-Ac024 TaxID=3344875 RepID=UPI0035CEE97F